MATGWGNKTWGASDWGDLSNETISVSGISLTSTIDSSTAQANADIDVIGSQLTFTNAGAVGGSSVSLSVAGIQATLSMGEEDIARGIQQDVTGSQLTTTPGAVTIDDQFLIGAGWGRDSWGSLAWGDAYSVQLVGIPMTTSIGEEAAGTDVVVAVSGNQLDITYANPSFSIQIDQDIFVLASEDQLDGAVGSLTFQADANVTVTNSAPNFEFTAQGNAALSTDQAKFGSASLLLDGTDDYVDTTTNLDLSSGDFTVDVWIRPSSVTGYKGIWQSGTSTTEQSYLLGNQVYWTINPSTIISSSVTVNADEWTMLSYEREGNTHRIYKNGTLEDTDSTSNKQDNGLFSIGKNGFGDFNGYIDEFRVSDIARYGGSSFTEPTQAFSFDSDTQFLLHFDGADGSTVIKSADDTLFQGTFSEGQVVGGTKTPVDVTGIQATLTLGDFTLVQSTVESITGLELTSSIGEAEEIPSQIIGLTGLEVTSSIGSVTVIGEAAIDVTGIQLTSNAGSLNITAWAEIDPGVNNIWEPVDLAA